MKNLPTLRERIIEYVKKEYNTKPEYLWRKFPNYVVFRNTKNKKWYAAIMDVPYSKLGINKNGVTDIINLKIIDPMFKEFLLSQFGFLKAYHMAPSNWISVVLDNSVEIEKILDLIDESYNSIDKRKKPD